MTHGTDPLAPARGILIGILISIGLYAVIGGIVFGARAALHDFGPNLHLGARE